MHGTLLFIEHQWFVYLFVLFVCWVVLWLGNETSGLFYFPKFKSFHISLPKSCVTQKITKENQESRREWTVFGNTNIHFCDSTHAFVFFFRMILTVQMQQVINLRTAELGRKLWLSFSHSDKLEPGPSTLWLSPRVLWDLGTLLKTLN